MHKRYFPILSILLLLAQSGAAAAGSQAERSASTPLVPSPHPNWFQRGDQANAWLGHSVSAAGDVNGDGYGDVIVGAPVYTVGGYSGSGRVYVYYGSASGLSPAPDWTAESDQGAYFGWSVSAAGDVNSDGYGDVIVGAWTYYNGEGAEGRAYVYHGSAAGLSLFSTLKTGLRHSKAKPRTGSGFAL